MAEFHAAALPERLQQAFQAKQTLAAAQQVYFAPIRHHSPACAYALQHYIEALQPTHILIEAPHRFQFLLEALLDENTQPPIAIFAQAQQQKATQAKQSNENQDTQGNQTPALFSAYYPFCEYSPEWVALKQGAVQHAKIEFIDLSWQEQSAFKLANDSLDWSQKNLISEHYLAHSQYIQNLAQQLHCRNHDELWDHLFELQCISKLKQAEKFFEDVFTWCSLARLDYEQDVLLQEASLHREDCMWQKIQACLSPEHKILVVTGGFHTLALIENLTQKNTAKRYPIQVNKKDKWQENAWLIRYSFDRLDALNGYASGMPSPAFYQQFWQDLNQADLQEQQQDHADDHLIQQQFLKYLTEICHHLEDKKVLDVTAYIALKNTAELALQLAHLRGHYRPSRYDLLDALQSALVKGEVDDGQQLLFQEIYTYLSGQQLGNVAVHQHSPALLQNIFKQIEKYRFNVSDTIPRHRKLDIYRKPLQQEISQFLNLLEFVDCGFAHRLSGPDFTHGAGMDLLFEEWRYAWSPSVEARLIELAELGDQLPHIALGKILALQQYHQQNGRGQSAFETAKLLTLACRLGLKEQLNILQQQLDDYLETDQSLHSVVAAAQQLYYLWSGRKLLQLPEHILQHSLVRSVQQACFLLEQLYDTHEDKIEENLNSFKTLHHLILSVSKLKLQQENDTLLDLFYQHIERQQFDHFHLSKLKGALDTLMFLDHRIDQEQLQQYLKIAFAVGCDANEAVQYVQGMFAIAPEIFVQSPIAISALYDLVKHWQEETFLQILPDLRYIFSQLSPKQNSAVSQKVARMAGLAEDVILDQAHSHISEQDMLKAAQLNQQLQQLLQHDQLEHWITGVAK
ncbi:DUF5682 family protein [Acinetobacter piscicola]|uniref:DUF5682 family protein n=1 Tax=Acinetobacter piscicola TaxID=2006115 RepID=UPI003558EAE0